MESLFDVWLEASGQKIKPLEKRMSHINARLDDGFTAEQIADVMTFVATDKWHIDEGHNTIEIAIRSTEQFEKKLIKATAVKNQSANQGNSDAHNQPANSQHQQFDTSTTSGYAAKLDADADAYYAEQAAIAEQTAYGSPESAF